MHSVCEGGKRDKASSLKVTSGKSQPSKLCWKTFLYGYTVIWNLTSNVVTPPGHTRSAFQQQLSHKGADTALGERAKPTTQSDRQEDFLSHFLKSLSPPFVFPIFLSVLLNFISYFVSRRHNLTYTCCIHNLFPRPTVSWGCFTGAPAMSRAGLGMSITRLW